MDEDAPVLMGKMRVAWEPSSSPSSFSNYAPHVALFPELHACSVPAATHSMAVNNVDGLARDASLWDVATLVNFRGAATTQLAGGGAASSSPAAAGGNNGGAGRRTTAREALAALVASGRLPGGSSTKSVPSPVDIVKALDRFATEVGVTDEDAAALRSQHFLHLLGFQRLEQLRGNLHAFGVVANDNRSSSSSSTAAFSLSSANEPSSPASTAINSNQNPLPCQMFRVASEEGSEKKTTADAKWVVEKTKLYDAVLELVKEQQEQQNKNNNDDDDDDDDDDNKKRHVGGRRAVALWPAPAAGASATTQTQADPATIGTAVGGGVKLEAEEPPAENIDFRSFAPSPLTNPFTLRFQWTTTTTTTNDTAEVKQEDNSNNRSISFSVQVSRVAFGRAEAASDIRQRRGRRRPRSENDETENENADLGVKRDDDNDEDFDSPLSQVAYAPCGAFHVDLARIAQYLSRGRDSGTHISRTQFVLLSSSSSSSSSDSLQLLPCGRNLMRVNGSVVYAAPRAVTRGDRITIGSGSNNNSGGGVLVITVS